MAQGVVPAGYRVYPSRVNMYQETVGRSLAAGHGDRPALVWDGGSLTYAELDTLVGRVAAGLRGLGVAPGTPVLMRSPNTPEAVVTTLALFRLGAVAVMSNSQLRQEEVAYLLDNSEARIACAPREHAGPIEALAAAGALDHVILLDAGLEEAGEPAAATVAYAALAAFPALAPVADTAAEDPAFMVYSSGTTGRPKGIRHAQRWVIALGDMVVLHNEYEPGCITMTPGEFSFMGTFGNNLIGPLRAGATVVLHWGRATPRGVLEAVARFGVTQFLSVPTLYRRILAEPGVEEGLDLSAVRSFMSAGESLGSTVPERWSARFAFPILEIYGVSEVMTCIANTLYNPIKYGSMGKGLPGLRLAILDDRLQPVAPGESGRLMIHRSDPGMYLGYYKAPEKWQAAHKGEWYDTGDVMRQDEDGYFYYLGRNDDLFKSRGYFISPQEIENILLRHPAVAEAAVIGIPDEAYGNRIAAFVKLGGDSGHVAPEAILSATAELLAPYKMPKSLEILPEIPKNPVGKIQRSALVKDIGTAD